MSVWGQLIRDKCRLAAAICVLGGIVTAAASPASAQKITLKNTFLFGYTYSVDSLHFLPLGPDGKFLSAEMEDIEEALDEMKAYRSRRAYGDFAAWSGMILIGLSLLRGANGEGGNSQFTMLKFGIPLVLGAVVVEITAVDHLKKAVQVYNERSQFYWRPVNAGGEPHSPRDHPAVFLTLRF